jgi:hypothetical protein
MAESRQKEAAVMRRNLERNGWVCYRRHHMPFLLNPLVCGLTTDNFDSDFNPISISAVRRLLSVGDNQDRTGGRIDDVLGNEVRNRFLQYHVLRKFKR